MRRSTCTRGNSLARSKGEWGGHPRAAVADNNVLVLFNKVATPPPNEPQSAIWHFGWHVTDSRKTRRDYQRRPEVKLLPLYTADEGGSVLISSDTWPSIGTVLGLTTAQIAEAKASDVKPTGGGGFAYMTGPDNALVEYRRQPSGRSASTMSICGRKTRSARSSGIRST